MAFIQIVEGHTDHLDEINKLSEAWEAATEGRRTSTRSILTVDRNDPRHFTVIVFFDSYESAMENSNMPETQEFSGKLVALLDGPPSFSDLEVVEDNS
ncbi:MAG: hypothetical protein ABIR57_07235 [Aeromicrobium sp.]